MSFVTFEQLWKTVEGLSINGAEGLGGHAEGFEQQNQGVTRRAPGEGPKVNGGRAQSQEMDSYDQPQYEFAEKIPGGLASGKDPSDFDQEALSKGIDVEMEHTLDPQIAIEIAMDHLEEDPEYYDKLEKMEGGDVDESIPGMKKSVADMKKAIATADKVWGKPDPRNVNVKRPPLPPEKPGKEGGGPLPKYGDPMYWATDEGGHPDLKEFFDAEEQS